MPSLKPDTPLARYIFNSDNIRPNGKIRPGPFKPKKGDDLSVFDVAGLDHLHRCEHGHQYADNPDAGRIHVGYAVIDYCIYFDLGLIGVYDNDPPRHVSIGPTDLPEYRREQAQLLSAKAAVHRC